MIDWNYVYCLQPTKLPIIDSKSWLILSISLGCLVFSYFGILQCSSWPEGYNVTSREWSVNPPLADGMSHICAFVPRALHIGTEHAIYILHKNGVSCWSHWQDQWMIQCQTKVNRISCFSSLCCAFSTFDWNIVFINHCWHMDKSELFLLYFMATILQHLQEGSLHQLHQLHLLCCVNAFNYKTPACVCLAVTHDR